MEKGAAPLQPEEMSRLAINQCPGQILNPLSDNQSRKGGGWGGHAYLGGVAWKERVFKVPG
jgi:hypothetical protein